MPKQATGACMQRGVRIAADADGRRVVLVLALHATMLSAVSASAQPAAGAAFIGNSALVLAGGVGAKRPGTVLLKNSCFPKMLAAGWSVGMGDGGTLRLRGGSLLDRCLPVSLQRQPQTRTCFTSANLVGALAGGSSTHAASPAARTPRVVFILGGPGAGKVGAVNLHIISPGADPGLLTGCVAARERNAAKSRRNTTASDTFPLATSCAPNVTREANKAT